MEGLLARIVENKKEELKQCRLELPLKEIKIRLRDVDAPRDFLNSISRLKDAPIRLIAEIKKGSPIKGIFIEDLKADDLAVRYEDSGASAISVITERRFFSGDPGYIEKVKGAVKLPVLRKDFLIDEYHIHEARYIGADAVLLITSILEKSELSDFISLTEELGMQSLVEIHNEKELERALNAGARIIGINNRDLATFKVDLNITLRIIKEIPEDRITVSESGVDGREDVRKLLNAGVHAILVGESIVSSKDPGEKIKELMSNQKG